MKYWRIRSDPFLQVSRVVFVEVEFVVLGSRRTREVVVEETPVDVS